MSVSTWEVPVISAWFITTAVINIDSKSCLNNISTNCYYNWNNNCAWSVIIFRYSYCNFSIWMWSNNYAITWLNYFRNIIRCCWISILIFDIRSYSLNISLVNRSVRINNTRSLRCWRSSFILNCYFYLNLINWLIRISYNYSCIFRSWFACVNWIFKFIICSTWKITFVWNSVFSIWSIAYINSDILSFWSVLICIIWTC